MKTPKRGRIWEVRFYLQKAAKVVTFYDILEKIKQEWVQEQVVKSLKVEKFKVKISFDFINFTDYTDFINFTDFTDFLQQTK